MHHDAENATKADTSPHIQGTQPRLHVRLQQPIAAPGANESIVHCRATSLQISCQVAHQKQHLQAAIACLHFW